MDIGTAIIGAVFVAVCVFPFAMASNKYKKTERQILQQLNEMATKQYAVITQYDLCGNIAIGIDEQTQFLFYILKEADQEHKQVIDLASIKTCSTNCVKTANRVIDKLELILKHKAKSKADDHLLFYSNELSFQLNGELQVIEKWNGIINQQL